jgi:hypothetical protein
MRKEDIKLIDKWEKINNGKIDIYIRENKLERLHLHEMNIKSMPVIDHYDITDYGEKYAVGSVFENGVVITCFSEYIKEVECTQ